MRADVVQSVDRCSDLGDATVVVAAEEDATVAASVVSVLVMMTVSPSA